MSNWKRCITHHNACDCREHHFAEIEEENKAMRKVLAMVNESIYDFEEPDPNATTREWCDRFSTYLRGCVEAQASFTPEEWAELRQYA